MASPTQRTLERLRRSGYCAAVVERWNAHVGIRQDVFGIIDILAVGRGEPGVLGIQCTTSKNLAARVTKAKKIHELLVWLQCGNRFSCWGWHKVEGTWRARVVVLTAADITPEVLPERLPERRRGKQQALPF